MPLPKIDFVRTQGLGIPATGQDHISGLMLRMADGDLPTGFSTGDRVKKIFSVQQAEDLGIVDTHSDETKATGGNVEITLTGAEDDTATIKIDEVVLGTYTLENSDAVADVAAGLRTAINALTSKHGFVAGGSTANVALTAPAKMGEVLNNATIAFSTSGSATATATQFSSGAGSYLATAHYHIEEFFRAKPDATLYVGIYDSSSAYDGSDVESMQDASNGEIRQLGIYIHDETFAASQVTATQTYLETLRDNKKNLFAELHADMSSLTLSTLSDLTSLTASKVSVCLGEDGNYHQAAYAAATSYVAGDKVKWLNKTYICGRSATGQAPYDNDYFTEVSLNLPDIVGHSVSTLGNMLGTTAETAPSESIAHVERFRLDSGNTLSVAGFATGDLYGDQAIGQLNSLNDQHYTFLRSFTGLPGVYYNDNRTAVSETNDYSSISNNRVMDKAERLLYERYLPKLNSRIFVNDDGTLTDQTINEYITEGQIVTDQLDRELNISGSLVTMDSAQNSVQTGKIEVSVDLVAVGIARNIVVNNRFVTQIA